MRSIRWVALALMMAMVQGLYGQNNDKVVRHNYLEGNWRGAAIWGGTSLTHFDARIFSRDDSLFIFSNVPEWAYYDGVTSYIERKGPVLNFSVYLGKATVLLDTLYTEMVGTIGEGTPPLAVHFKKVPEPSVRKVEKKEVEFDLGDIKVPGAIFYPEGVSGPMACAVMVSGRGCGPGYFLEDRARGLARYGIATVTYDKRGSDGTGVDCDLTTVQELAEDLEKVVKQVRKMDNVNPDQVGTVAFSAGGWVAPYASLLAKKKPFAFMIGSVTPSTTVKEQQVGCAKEYVANELGLDEVAVEQSVAYTKLMFAKPNKKNLDLMMGFLEEAKTRGWIDVLEDSDIPADLEGYKNLWVQRHAYDPREALSKFEGPFLAILGETDFIVPVQENVDRYVEIFSAANKDNYRIVTIPGAGHGMEHGYSVRRLPYVEGFQGFNYYLKADRVAAGAQQEMVDFLRKYGFLRE